MIVTSDLTISSMIKRRRFDASYYEPQYLIIEKAIRQQKNWTTLGELTRPCFSKGIFDIRADDYVQSGIPFVRITNLRNGLIETDRIVYLTAERSKKDARTELSQFDIVLSKTAYPAASLVQLPCCNVSQDIIAVKTNKGRQFNCFLVAFLNSRFGLPQMRRLFQGNIQSHLGLNEARDVLVPLPDTKFMAEIEQLFVSGLKSKDESRKLMTTAHHIMEKELGIDAIDLADSNGNEILLSESSQLHRWDSEFYKPKYQRVIHAVIKARKVRIDKLISVGTVISYITNGHTPLHHDLFVGDVPFLTAEHVSDFRVDFGTDKRILRRHHETELARTALRNGDILITIKGKVGNCAVVLDCPQEANINQDVALIRLRGVVHPYFFAAWFNSLMGKQLVEQRSTGGINPFLGLGNLRGMPFPMIAPKEQERIGHLIQTTVEKARDAEREATNLLEQAKYRIEELIETAAIR